jgi:glycosyltransferase involved in cell wall biosynthesis
MGVPIVREKINCARATAKRILDAAYAKLGEKPNHGITESSIAHEERQLKFVDAIFCPSPLVAESVGEIGVAPSKQLLTSYGFCPERIQTTQRLLDPIDGPTFVFIGTVCVRKGAHLILNAWTKSGIKGRLVLAGNVESVIASRCAANLNRPDVLLLNYVSDVGALINSADVFVFPSLEEGAPLVTYEAAAGGLAAIVSPMGASQIIRNGMEGLVIDPYDTDGWINAMRELAVNESLRNRYRAAARQRSLEFTWPKVGAKRRELLNAFFGGRQSESERCSTFPDHSFVPDLDPPR